MLQDAMDEHPVLSYALLIAGAVSLALAAILTFTEQAGAVECPPPMTACKVLFLNPQEEAILTQPNGILDTAAQGRKIELGEVSLYFRNRITSAPAGEVKAPDKPEPPK